MKKTEETPEEFGDFDAQDALESDLVLTDEEWEGASALQLRFDEVKAIADPQARKEAAKALVREMNGEVNG